MTLHDHLSSAQPYPHDRVWEWFSRRTGILRQGPLVLHWRMAGDSISDGYSPQDIRPEDLWCLWINELHELHRTDQRMGDGWVPVQWFARGMTVGISAGLEPEATDLYFRAAVLTGHRVRVCEQQQFLAHFTWPRCVVTGEPVNWLRVPVFDKQWTVARADSGGFVQEATSWKPSGLQPRVHLPTLAASAGLYWPARSLSVKNPIAHGRVP